MDTLFQELYLLACGWLDEIRTDCTALLAALARYHPAWEPRILAYLLAHQKDCMIAPRLILKYWARRHGPLKGFCGTPLINPVETLDTVEVFGTVVPLHRQVARAFQILALLCTAGEPGLIEGMKLPFEEDYDRLLHKCVFSSVQPPLPIADSLAEVDVCFEVTSPLTMLFLQRAGDEPFAFHREVQGMTTSDRRPQHLTPARILHLDATTALVRFYLLNSKVLGWLESSNNRPVFPLDVQRPPSLGIDAFEGATTLPHEELLPQAAAFLPNVLLPLLQANGCRTEPTIAQTNVLFAMHQIWNRGSFFQSRYHCLKTLGGEFALLHRDGGHPCQLATGDQIAFADSFDPIFVQMETGAGKTFLALVAALLFSDPRQPNLIVVPKTLSEQWRAQIVQHFGEVNPFCCVFSAKDAESCRSSSHKVHVIHPSVVRLRAWQPPQPFFRTFVDEPQDICESKSWNQLFPLTRSDEVALSASTRTTCYLSATLNRNWHLTRASAGYRFQTRLGTGRALDHHDPDLGPRVLVARRCDAAENRAPLVPVCVPVAREPLIENARRLLQTLHARLPNITKRNRVLGLLERLASGGRVNGVVVTQLLRRYLDGEPEGTVLQEAAPTACFALPSDDCAVCLGSFDEPLQSACGHVYCAACMAAVCASTRRCPVCRRAWGGRAEGYKPTWHQSAEEEGDAETGARDEEKVLCALGPESDEDELSPTPDAKRPLPANVVGLAASLDSEGWVELQSKQQALLQLVAAFLAKDLAGKQLVVATAHVERHAAAIRAQVGAEVRVLQAGRGPLRSALGAIEQLKTTTDPIILVMQSRFHTGFDLNTVSDMVIVDWSRHPLKFEQLLGRTTRIVRRFPTVNISVLVYERFFDHFLFVQRKELRNSNLTLCTARAMQTFMTQDFFGSPAHVQETVRAALETALGQPVALRTSTTHAEFETGTRTFAARLGGAMMPLCCGKRRGPALLDIVRDPRQSLQLWLSRKRGRG